MYYIVGAEQQTVAGRAGKSVPGGALKNYRKAVIEYQKALAIREDNASYHSNLGTAYFALREFPAAINEYVRAMQIDPGVFEHRSQTGITAQMSSPEDRAYYSFVLARIYAKAGDLDHALEYLRKAMEDGYKDIDSVYKDQEFRHAQERSALRRVDEQQTGGDSAIGVAGARWRFANRQIFTN